MRYMVVLEQGPTSVGAYVPDLPRCVAVGETEAEALELIRGAIALHLDGIRADGESIPEPSSRGEYVDVAP